MGINFYKAWNKFCSQRNSTNTGRFFTIFLLLIAISTSIFSQTTSFSFTAMPASPDFPAPGRGAEQWNGAPWDNNNNPYIPAGNSNPLNTYYRFNWTDIESSTTQGSYNWTVFDNQINSAIDGGAMFSFGVMPMCSACGLSGFGYPTYLHNLMQAEATNSRDWQDAEGDWIPNWNSPNYLGRYKALLQAIASHIATGTHSGKNYKDAIYYVDIRGFGDFGEWHTYPFTSEQPTGRTATIATLDTLISYNLQIFPNYPNIALIGVFDGGNASVTPPTVSYYALTQTNTWGQIGWRRDNWGDPGYDGILASNTGFFNPGTGTVAFDSLITQKYKFAPVVGEPERDASAVTGSCGSMFCDLPREIIRYHATSFGNGNYPGTFSGTPAIGTNAISASASSGYRLKLTGGSMPTNLNSGGAFNITVNWQNIGIAPTYENWTVVYQLRNSSGTVVWTGNSAFNPKLFLPSGTPTAESDNFVLGTVATGTGYGLYMIVQDPKGFKKPLPLAITGRGTDGSYLLRNNITVVTGTGNTPPTANAGANQTITLPTSSVTLAGSGTDADGTITTYAWTNVSGPSGSTISTPSSANTNVTGLTQGVYVFNLKVTDNLDSSGTASVQITVNAGTTTGPPPPPPPPPAFTVNAGPDQTLPGGTLNTTLSGTIPASSPSAPASDTANLIVIWGESNAAGNADNSAALPSELASRSTVQILNHTTGKFENLHIGVNNEQDTYFGNTVHGMELGMANEVDSGNLSNPTYMVKIGVSGSYICQWLHEDGTTCRPSGNLWDGWMPFVDQAVAQMKALGKPFRIIVWQSIGLNDKYQVNTAPADFVSGMALFRADFRSRYGANIPFLGTDFNNPPAQTYDWTTLFTQMAASDPLFYSIPVTGATYVDGSVHYDYQGFKLIVHNMVKTMQTFGATGTGTTGTGVTYTSVWTKVSGPAGDLIVSPTAANTNITGLTSGTYVYKLSVANNTGTTVSDNVQVTVGTTIPPANQPPVANAGSNQTIQLPTSTVSLTGSGTDPDGTIASYAWTKLSGPSGGTISSPSTAATNVTGLIQGVYQYTLTVKDNLGATSKDTVQVTVNAAIPANQPPVANAGTDQTIQLPVSTVSFAGSGTDPDGTIASYAWAKISGPTGGVISTPTTANTNITGLIQGVYSYSLTVTDNSGAKDADTVLVTVNPAAPPANQPPIAKAGSDQTITLPTNSGILNGTASSDPDGSITAFLWTKISGPSQYTIGNNNSANTVANNLTAGSYSFQLKVTDNSGATALDTVKITVNAAPIDQPPVANAGADITITLPTNLTNLVGTASADPDGTITAYAWSQVSGPGTSSIASPASASTGVSGLQQGVYVYALKVTDNNGVSDFDSVRVTVNPAANVPPIANAGTSKSITLPVNSTNLDGSLSSDPDGSIVSYAWAQISGPSAATLTNGNSALASVANMVAGQYTFELTVTDNSGAVSKARVKISVIPAGPQPPNANAGADQTIRLPNNSVIIDGSASSASSGNIVSYTWTEKSGPSSVGLSNTVQNTINNLKAGVYVFSLIVTDNNGLTGTDSVIITVLPAANQAPVANAGPSISLTLPNNSTTLDGSNSSDPDGTITTYSWTEISGPGTPTESGANTSVLSLSGLQVGQYTYKLTVTDNSGASASALVKVKVAAAPNVLPVANAGPDQTITSPANSVILNGSASYDPDGTIKSYNWVTVSGPGSVTISNSNTATPSVTGLQVGQYIMELTVTDNSGAAAKSQVVITVLPKAVLPNQSPVANAGSNITITAPLSSTSLNGTSSFDPDGTITTFAWTQISGPSTAVIGAGTTSTATVSQLVVGQYVFQLKVTDNNGATGTDQVTVTVNPPVPKLNQAPVADAGLNDTISLPANTYTLNGSQSSDADGTIESYQWQQIGGPNTVNSSSMNSAQVSISDLQAGNYEFQLTVTDNEGATSTSTITLTVLPISNNTVRDQLIIYPNPAQNVINGKVISEVTGKVKIHVYDMNGKLVYEAQIEKSDDSIIKTMNISSLASGMYTIQINIANRKTMVAKFIKD